MAECAGTASFEECLAELDRVVRDLEDGQIGLEQALDRYEKGVGLLKHCYGLLQKVEQRILVLTGVDDNGQPVTAPFAAAEENNGSRPTTPRRPSKKNNQPDAENQRPELF